jgi:biopolymer transport protein ExbD
MPERQGAEIMAFALRGNPLATAEINITPLVDVMLVLLVIFMLSVPVATHRLVATNPAACPGNCPLPAQPAHLAIKRTGEMYWNGAAVTRAGLALQLETLSHQADAAGLEIALEPSSRYELLTEALAAAQDAGVRSIGLASAAQHDQASNRR